jgi:hypothetical protein
MKLFSRRTHESRRLHSDHAYHKLDQSKPPQQLDGDSFDETQTSHRKHLHVHAPRDGRVSKSETLMAKWACKKKTFSLKGCDDPTGEIIAACLYNEPTQPLVYDGKTHSIFEIKRNLCKAANKADLNFKFVGPRYRDPFRPEEQLLAHVFLDSVLLAWGTAKGAKPFALEFESGEETVAHAYDAGEIWKSASPPEGFKPPDHHRNITYYRADLDGAVVPREARRVRFWIAHDKKGAVLNSGWIRSDDAPLTPEFAYQPEFKE